MLNTNAAKHIRYTTRVGEQTNLSKSLCISKPKTDYDKPDEQDLKKKTTITPANLVIRYHMTKENKININVEELCYLKTKKTGTISMTTVQYENP